jgi:hypothetical protein
MIEELVELLGYVLLGFPGACIRWFFLRKKSTFWEVLREDDYANWLVGLFALVLVLTVFGFVMQWNGK